MIDTRMLTAAAAAAILLLAPLALGQDVRDIRFEGGSAATYLETLRDAWEGANIVVDDAVGAADLPEIMLRRVDLDGAIMFLNGYIDTDRSIQIRVSRQSGHTPIYFVQASGRRAPQRGETDTVVLSVEGTLDDHVGADAMLTAIETALALFGDDAGETTVRFHPETALVIAQGPEEQIRTLVEVVEQLSIAAGRRRQTESRAEEAEHAIIDIERMKREIARRDNELADARRQLVEWETRFGVIESELQKMDDLRVMLQQRDQQIGELGWEITRLRKEIEKLRSGGG